MRVNNTNQTSFGMKEILVMGHPATIRFAKLTRLVEAAKPRLREMGDNDTYLLVGNGEKMGEINVCAVTGCRNAETGELVPVTGKSQDRFILNPAKGLYELANGALTRIRLAFTFYIENKTNIDFTRQQLENLYKMPLDTPGIIAHDRDAYAYRQRLGEHLLTHGSYAKGTRR